MDSGTFRWVQFLIRQELLTISFCALCFLHDDVGVQNRHLHPSSWQDWYYRVEEGSGPGD